MADASAKGRLVDNRQADGQRRISILRLGTKRSSGWRAASVGRIGTGAFLVIGAVCIGLSATPAAASGPAPCINNHKYKASTACTVPAGMKNVKIEVAAGGGGAGGIGAAFPGGKGGSGSIVTGSYKVSHGQVLDVTVGSRGARWWSRRQWNRTRPQSGRRRRRRRLFQRRELHHEYLARHGRWRWRRRGRWQQSAEQSER
jgi:hypothetical protein